MFCPTFLRNAAHTCGEAAKEFKGAFVHLFYHSSHPASIPSKDPNALTIGRMPEEILLEIFTHCIPYNLFRMKLVCSHWLALAQNEFFWKKKFSEFQIAFEEKNDSQLTIEQKCYLLWKFKKEFPNIVTITTEHELKKHHETIMQLLKKNTFYIFYYQPQSSDTTSSIFNYPFFQLNWKDDKGESHWKLIEFDFANQKIKGFSTNGMQCLNSTIYS